MASGRTEHPGQTVPNGKERDLDLGGRREGRRQWSRKAVKNALEPELVKGILDAIRILDAIHLLNAHNIFIKCS